LDVWLNEKNQWIYPHLDVAQQRMTELSSVLRAKCAAERALSRPRELLLAQSATGPLFCAPQQPGLRSKTVTDHILRFTSLYGQLKDNAIDEPSLAALERPTNFPDVNFRYWAAPNYLQRRLRCGIFESVEEAARASFFHLPSPAWRNWQTR